VKGILPVRKIDRLASVERVANGRGVCPVGYPSSFSLKRGVFDEPSVMPSRPK
jgi:hypothetical protein